MSQFASKAVVSIKQLAIDNNTRTDTGAQSDDDKVLHASSHSVDHLTDGGSIGVVGQCYGDVVQLLAEQVGQWNNGVVSPRQVRSFLDSALVVVAVGGADAHRFDFLDTTNLLDDRL